ncbi:MAG: RnfABCDGE type electron transport complex subunit B [Oscillospiraceae bacterium]|nr:RnfABCDGE type electron transport complex subunit B [Oscillospiraceae bacterium]
MFEILIAIGILGGLGLIFGLVLAGASKVFYVETDPRLDQLNECLPGANCGGCGYAGCGGYAEAVLNGEAPIGKCASGGNECAQNMAAIMGVKAEAVTRKVALVRCSGEKRYDKSGNLVAGAKIKAEYEGFHDCVAASKIGGNGPLSCKFGCLGFGTCVKACKYDAISIVNGVAKVNEDRCVGCMACAAACPRSLIVPVEPGRNVVIACASLAKGAVTTRGCTVGCIGCGLCKKICPKDAITIEKNLAVIDYSKCDNCGLCATVCPKKLIKDSNVENLPDRGVVQARNN